MESGKFTVPSVEEMDEALDIMNKEPIKSHFQSGKLNSLSAESGEVKSKGENVTTSKVITQKETNSDPLAALKKSEFFNQAKNEFREMVVNEKKSTEGPAVSISKPIIPPISTNRIIVNPRQRGNPVLKGICNVAWEFGEIIPDYVMGRTTCALFLSVRYHSLNPKYIEERVKQLGHNYELRVLLVHVDVPDPQHALNQLMKLCMLTNLTMILAWSPEEAGRHLEVYKIFDKKPADSLMKKQESDNCSKVIDALTSVKSVNRSDAVVLFDNLKTLEAIINASVEQLSFCPGIGLQKAKRLHAVLNDSFLKPAFK
ncbi:Excision repair cross-complementation group 1 [Chamberlinius hualienensis]